MEVQNRASTSDWSIRSPDSPNHFLISSTLTNPLSFSSKHSNALSSSCSVSKSYKCSPIIVRNMGKVIPLSPEESNSAEGFLLCVPGRSLSRSSIRCFDALIPTSYERTERLSVVERSRRVPRKGTRKAVPRLAKMCFRSCSVTTPSASWSTNENASRKSWT